MAVKKIKGTIARGKNWGTFFPWHPKNMLIFLNGSYRTVGTFIKNCKEEQLTKLVSQRYNINCNSLCVSV